MESFFGLLFLVGIIGLILSLAMRKRDNFIGKNSKVILLVSIALVVITCIAAAIIAPKEEAHETNSSTMGSSEAVSSSASSAPTSQNSSVSSYDPVSQVSSANPESNPLLAAEWQTAPVMNGFQTEQVGERGYIQITKAELKEVTNEQMVEFADQRVRDSGLNWVSIVCGDGTGICFTGSTPYILSYGELDEDGAILETIHDYILKDGVYTE